MRSCVRPYGGYSLLEVLLTVALLGLLLFAVGDAVGHVLDATVLGETRQNVSQSAGELASRLASEARSSTAVFVPSVDVLGQPNSVAFGSHEVDFYRKASDGSPAFVAYRFDSQSNSVTRYEYVPVAGGPPHIVHQDQMAERVGAFQAVRTAPSMVSGIVGGGDVHAVNVYYGSRELVGGNGIVTVSVVAGLPGEPQQRFDIHLSSRAAPTDVSILVPSGSPPPSPSPSSSPINVGFVLTVPNFHLPHGPNHGGDPGDGEGNHGPGVPGFALFYGNGSGSSIDWLSFSNAFKVVTDGIYTFKDSHGGKETIAITCNDGPCPPFNPLPVQTAGPTIVMYRVP